jgi:hypothetical protein
MEDVFGTGNGAITEPSDLELGIEEEAPAGQPAGPPADGGAYDEGEGDDAHEEHPQGRAFRTMRERLATQDRELAELRKDREQKIRYEERMRALHEQNLQRQAQDRMAREAEAARKAAAEDPEPNRDEDLLAWNDWRVRQLERRLDGETQSREQMALQQQERERQGVLSRIAGEYTAWENRFALTRPDYQHAFAHVANAYAHMYRLRGVPDQNIVAALEDERARLIRDCLQINQQTGQYTWVRNPAEVIYGLALSLGYGGPDGGVDEGEEEQAPPPQAARPDPRTQRLGRSVAAAGRSGAQGRGGASPDGRWTLERFNALGDREAAQFMEQYPELAQELLSPNG